jgi:hypothetical protein
MTFGEYPNITGFCGCHRRSVTGPLALHIVHANDDFVLRVAVVEGGIQHTIQMTRLDKVTRVAQ